MSVLDVTARAVQAAYDWYRRTFTSSAPPPDPPNPSADSTMIVKHDLPDTREKREGRS